VSGDEWWAVPRPMGNFLGGGMRHGSGPRPAPTPTPAPAPAPQRSKPRPPATLRVVKPAPEAEPAAPPAPRAPAPPVRCPAAPLAQVEGVQPQPSTIRGVILRAACELANGSTATRLSLSDVVVRAWQLDPRLALRGYEDQHPDANRVLAKLCGPEGLIGWGMLARSGDGVVSVTRKGLIWWKAVKP
jgi:hypothetical protein